MTSQILKHGVILLLLVMGLAACVAPPRGNVLTEGMPSSLVSFTVPRSCTLTVQPISDLRPRSEIEETNQRKFRYIVPLLLFNFWSVAGPTYQENEYYDENLIANIGALTQNIATNSRVCFGGGRAYSLRIELLHYYGVSYGKNFAFAAAGGAAVTNFIFMPTGHVAMKLTLLNEISETVAVRYVNESFLFNPDHPSLSLTHSAQTGLQHHVNNMIQVASIALNRAMARLPRFIDEMLAADDNAGTNQTATPATFVVTRLTKEYDFEEKLIIEYESGKIAFNQIVFRTGPIVSRPDELVVVPYAEPGGRWLNRKQYQAHITWLKQKYDVDFTDNLTVATFKGMR